jgi:hypothetical protein
MDLLRALLRWLFTWLVVLVILFEEWGWEPLARLAERLARLPGLRWIERRICRLPPYAALAVFGVPALALLPVKLLALYVIGAGHPLIGLSVVVAAKVIGTALVAWLFSLTRPALMRLAWFARAHARWVEWKREVLAEVRATAAWHAARRMRRRALVIVERAWQRWVAR